jgi:hypothetical protein
MKARFSMLGLLFVSLSMVGLPTSASTPDGQTPAEETICDPLMAEDVSHGLYGLCLAFCEAQDIADEELPITEAELLALQDAAPSGSILNSYNSIKKETDPDMPCIVVDSTCPCWTAEELDAIDGMAPGGSTLDTLCVKAIDPATGTVDVVTAIETSGQPNTIFRVTAWDVQRNGIIDQRCSYRNTQVDPDDNRNLSVATGTMTPGQAEVCLAEVITRCAVLGF